MHQPAVLIALACKVSDMCMGYDEQSSKMMGTELYQVLCSSFVGECTLWLHEQLWFGIIRDVKSFTGEQLSVSGRHGGAAEAAAERGRAHVYNVQLPVVVAAYRRAAAAFAVSALDLLVMSWAHEGSKKA